MFDPKLDNQELQVASGRYYKTLKVKKEGERLFFNFGFDRYLMNEIKMSMDGAKWHGYDPKPRKLWSAKNTPRTRFILDFLCNINPYAQWERPLIEFEPRKYPGIKRPYEHQYHLAQTALTYRRVIWAAEMGTGKSLSSIMAVEESGFQGNEVWFVGPKNAVRAFERELVKWNAQFVPRHIMTYDKLKSVMKDWDGGSAPKCVIFDESSRIKTHSSQRSQAALFLAQAMLEEHGPEAMIILMSGTPAPKNPVDWWHQCEVACPGFIYESHPGKLKNRLALIEQRDGLAGGSFPHLVTWRDDENKCKHCGEIPQPSIAGLPSCRCGNYEKSVNEVGDMYERLKGLVVIKKKSDCLDLPEKQYQEARIKPTIEMIRAARLIKDTSSRAITIITLLRELSDGFQYVERQEGMKKCELCQGSGKYDQPTAEGTIEIDCPSCGGRGEVPVTVRHGEFIGSPKLDRLQDDLRDLEDIGRVVVWAGFTGTIDLLIEKCLSWGWTVLRIDGKGWTGYTPEGETLNSNEMLDAMDASHPRAKELKMKYPKLLVVGNPASGSMAFTFTTAPVAIYYSNDFNGESRIQSEDRIHRIGMSKNRGATIIDYICLPTDLMILNNLRAKKRLQNLTLGEIEEYLNDI